MNIISKRALKENAVFCTFSLPKEEIHLRPLEKLVLQTLDHIMGWVYFVSTRLNFEPVNANMLYKISSNDELSNSWNKNFKYYCKLYEYLWKNKFPFTLKQKIYSLRILNHYPVTFLQNFNKNFLATGMSSE